MANHLKFDAAKKTLFIERLIETGGNAFAAAKLISISIQTVYNYRNSDPEFAAAWEAAIEEGTKNLEAEAYRRAFEGVEETVYRNGKKVGMVRKYSDVLLIFLLKARDSKYKDSVTVAGELDLRSPDVVSFLKAMENHRRALRPTTVQIEGES